MMNIQLRNNLIINSLRKSFELRIKEFLRSFFSEANQGRKIRFGQNRCNRK
jgi:hypothetical protein